MNEIIKPKSVNFEELVRNSNTTLTLNSQSKMISLLTEEFTDKELQWYIANLYIYLNYHPTDDYPINLENVYRMLGFANKGNAMKTIKSNFTKDEDYKTSFIPKEKSSWGGSGIDEIMLNVDTFKNLAMIVKTPQGTEIRKYYIKMENIHNKVIKMEFNEQKLIQETTSKLLKEKEQLLKNKELQIIEMSRKKITKYQKLESVYIGTDNFIRSKVGSTKDENTRISTYKVNNPDFEIKYIIPCNDYKLIERIVKHILKQYTLPNYNEWFSISCEKLKIILETIVYIVDDTMNTNDINIINDVFYQVHNLIFNSDNQNHDNQTQVNPNLIDDQTYDDNIQNTNDNLIDDNLIDQNDDNDNIENTNGPKIKIQTIVINQMELVNTHFTESLYKDFINNCCELSPDKNYRESGKDLMDYFKIYLQDTVNQDKINNLYNENIYTKKTYHYLFSFKKEFYENLSKILNTKSIDFQNNLKYQHGFNGILIKDKKVPLIFDEILYLNFFTTKLTFTNKNTDKIKTKDLLQKFLDYLNVNNVIDTNKALGGDIKKNYGFNINYKMEFLQLLIKWNSDLKEQRIRFDLPNVNMNRGFYKLEYLQL